jgi:signal transduction histidine kinase
MRRRLIAVVAGTVAAALTLAALLAFILIEREARSTERRVLAEATKRVSDRGSAGSAVRSLETVGEALELDSAAQIFVTIETASEPVAADSEAPFADPDAPEIVNSFGELPLGALDAATNTSAIARLRSGRVISGIDGNQAWAVAPVRKAGLRLETLLFVRTLPDTARQTLRSIAIASAAALVLAAAASVLIARGLSRPLREATAAYRRIASGDLSVRADRSNRDRQRTDEIGELTRALDTMTTALERARNQERSFLMSVSHDLRTPLTSIRGYAEAIAEGTAPDDRRAAEVISSESRRLERLVRDLLDLAKLEADQFTLRMRDTDVTDLVTDAADGFLPTATRAGLQLELDAEDGIRAVTDPERCMQVIANLTENALKYARSTVTVALHRLPSTGSTAPGFVVSVQDDGPGIPEHELPHVFERSFTSDRGARSAGSGLGLAIVAELVAAMGGVVRIETSTTGTTFRAEFADAHLPGWNR